MQPGLETLLDGVIDYAGLFPPAKLDMEPALQEYLRHIAGPESLLLNRFVCPVDRLSELGDLIAHSNPESSFPITVIGSSVDHAKEDRKAIEAHEQRFGNEFEVEGYEVRASSNVHESLRQLEPLTDFDLFLEVPLDAHVGDSLHAIAETETASAKARTGGLEASAFPSSARLAEFLRECLDLNLSFKLTAGLHHPVRRPDPQTGATMHGFLNVLFALALAEEHELTRAEIASVLEDQDPRNFFAEGNEVGYRGFRTDVDSIEAMRTLFAGFGSCSVDEPVADLRALGLW